MKLEYFPNSGKEGALISIYGKDRTQIKQLQLAFMSLFEGKSNRVPIHRLPGFESVDGCELFATVGKRNDGVRMISEKSFEWILKNQVWDDMALFIEPFLNLSEDGTHFQHLNPYIYPTSGTSVVISTARVW